MEQEGESHELTHESAAAGCRDTRERSTARSLMSLHVIAFRTGTGLSNFNSLIRLRGGKDKTITRARYRAKRVNGGTGLTTVAPKG